jgi:hypothetical protein
VCTYKYSTRHHKRTTRKSFASCTQTVTYSFLSPVTYFYLFPVPKYVQVVTFSEVSRIRIFIIVLSCILVRRYAHKSQIIFYVRLMQTNSLHCLSSLYFFNHPLHVSSIFVAHHQEVYCIYRVSQEERT